MRRRRTAFALVLALAGCGGGGGSASSPAAATTPQPGQTLVYVAIGASDAVGVGASVPCADPATVAAPTCPGGTGYVPVLARSLATAGVSVQLDDLGISGAVLGPAQRTAIDAYELVGAANACAARSAADDVPADFITNELPFVPADASLVTVFAGGNDALGLTNALACGAGGATAATQQAYVDAQIAAFGTALDALVAGIRSRAPAAKIIVANLPNFSRIPLGLAETAAVQAALGTFSVGFDRTAIAPLAAQLPVVDLLCDPLSYDSGRYSSDGFHPNDAGYAALASAFYVAETATAPATPAPACAFDAVAAIRRR